MTQCSDKYYHSDRTAQIVAEEGGVPVLSAGSYEVMFWIKMYYDYGQKTEFCL
jgi:hypothetical protein